MLFKKSYNIHDVLGHELILATNPKPKQKEKYIPSFVFLLFFVESTCLCNSFKFIIFILLPSFKGVFQLFLVSL